MKSNKASLFSFNLLIFTGLMLASCGKPADDNASVPVIPLKNGLTIPSLSGINVLTMGISDTTQCSSATNYINKPCVTVTVCNTDGSNCTTINDILVDTGSIGLRVFKQALGTTTPTQITTAGKNLNECIQFGDGSRIWGPVAKAQIKLGGEPAVTVPVQIGDASTGGMSANCSGADVGPTGDANGDYASRLNGILGVGNFMQDCGTGCVTHTNGLYYACTGSSCAGTNVSLANQVTNPVTQLPVDNNGVILMLPDLPLDGAVSTSGYLVLGIGTRNNNAPSNVDTYPMDPSTGSFTTTFNGHTQESFLDSGSNGYFFPGASVLSKCTAEPDWFCPSSVSTLSAVNHAYGNSTAGTVQFQIENFHDFLHNSPNWAVKEIGGDSAGGGLNGVFDWGLSFHFGRNVYVGFEGKTSSIGSGTYWAY